MPLGVRRERAICVSVLALEALRPPAVKERLHSVFATVFDRREQRMDVQRTGRIFGWFFIGTFVTSIPARLLFVDGLGAKWTDVRFVPGQPTRPA